MSSSSRRPIVRRCCTSAWREQRMPCMRPRPAAGADRASHAPQARNSPSSSHRWVKTKIEVIRNAIVGSSRRASAPASPAGIAPTAITMTTAGPAATASGPPRGLTTARACTTSSASTKPVWPVAAFSVVILGGQRRGRRRTHEAFETCSGFPVPDLTEHSQQSAPDSVRPVSARVVAGNVRAWD